MQALLDTNAFLWWVTNNPKLSSRAREVIADPQNIIFFSIASAWEIIIKAKLGKLPLPESPESYIPSRIRHYDFQVLTIKMNHVLQIWELDNHHNDPFDRLLIAQSQTENLPIITADAQFSSYKVKVIW